MSVRCNLLLTNLIGFIGNSSSIGASIDLGQDSTYPLIPTAKNPLFSSRDRSKRAESSCRIPLISSN
jgi:hypothetical protein